MAKSSRKQNRRQERKRSRGRAVGGSSRADRLDTLLTAVRAEPEALEPRLALATWYLYQAEHDRIIATLAPVLDTARPADPDIRAHLNRLLAYGYTATKQYDRAEKIIEQGIEQTPNALDLWYLRAFVSMSLSQFAAATIAGDRYLELLDRAANRDTPDDAFAATPAHRAQLLNLVGSALLERRKFEASQRRFEESIEADPGNHLPYLNLIRLHEQQGNRDAAVAVCEKGLKACRTINELRMHRQSLDRHASVCACLIVRDEEAQLARCLGSIRSWVDDIVVVDTGSTDRTVEIAESFGARVFHQPWEGDFSKHRNFSIDQATGEWVLIIDADEEFRESDRAVLEQALNNKENDIVCLNVFNIYPDRPDTHTFLPSVRLFRRALGLRYEGIVHNQLVIPEAVTMARVNAAIYHYGYGLDAETMTKKLNRTRDLLERQLQQEPDNPFALFNYAQLLRANIDGFTLEHAETVIDVASRAVALTDPGDPKVRHLHLMSLNHIAWCRFFQERFDEALETARRALKIRPDYLDPLFLLGHVYSQLGAYESARGAYRDYLEVQAGYDPAAEAENLILLHVDSRAGAFYGLALLDHADHRLGEAADWYRKTLAVHPGYLEASARLGQLVLAEGKVDEAVRLFEQQLEQGQPNATAHLGLAYIARLQEDYIEAEHHYREAIRLDPDNVTPKVRLAEVLLRARRPEAVIELFADTDIQSEPAAAMLAQAHYQRGEFEAALPLFERLANDEKTGNDRWLNDLANCYVKMERLAEAEDTYRRALRQNPAEIAAARNLGVILARQERWDEAREMLELALERQPDQPVVHHLLGDLAVAEGDFGAALPRYETVLRLQPQDSLALFRVAECYLALGHEDAAKLGFTKVLEQEPGFKPARQRLKALDQGPGTPVGVTAAETGERVKKSPAEY